MPRSVTVGNGNLLVGMDDHGHVRDLYFPYVGYANHISGASGNFMHRIGVFVDDEFAWLDDSGWDITISGTETSAVGTLTAVHKKLSVTLTSTDAVHNEENVFLRAVDITNNAAQPRTIKVFFAQQFRISESRRGDTGYYDPRVQAIVHYKGSICLLVNALLDNQPFVDYNIGLFGIEGKEGTYLDALDGQLERNSIEHGSVDSVIGFTTELAAGESSHIDYWIVCAHSVPEAHTMDEYVLRETPARLVASTKAYWQAWVDKDESDLSMFAPELQNLYQRSLVTIRVHTDNRGGIIASSDTDMLHHGRDTYSYVWPRDGALIVRVLDQAGYVDIAQQFYSFITSCLEPAGYLMHKYRSDGTLGSSWHSWLNHGVPRLPIQEDETALIVATLWQHYDQNRDLEFIESLYNPFIEPAAQFMTQYVESSTGLPQASFDLWEEKYLTSTYTAAATVEGLLAASRFAILLGKESDARTYQAVAQRMQQAILEYLYDDDLGMFVKGVTHLPDGSLEYDKTIDTSSFFGPVYFDIVDVHDARITRSLQTINDRLQVQASSQGYVRYEADTYYTMQDAGTPNPWVITTLWVAQYYIKSARSIEELEPAYKILEWTCSHAVGAGILAEQMHPHTRVHLSTAPLVWSHAEFVATVHAYRDAYLAFKATLDTE